MVSWIHGSKGDRRDDKRSFSNMRALSRSQSRRLRSLENSSRDNDTAEHSDCPSGRDESLRIELSYVSVPGFVRTSSPSLSIWKSVQSHGESHGALSKAATLMRREYSWKRWSDETIPDREDTSRAEDMSSKYKSSARSLDARSRGSQRRIWLARVFREVVDIPPRKMRSKR